MFGYDAAVTFANFIATPSLLDAFAVHSQQPTIPVAGIASNDHVLVSLISHLVYSLTGSRSEAVYRILPALAAGGTVGVTSAALVRRFGTAAAVCAGLLIATNPLFIDNSRDLRGYSLAAFFAVVATVLYVGLTAAPGEGEADGGGSRWAPRSGSAVAMYGLALGLAITAHVFAGLVLVAHVGWAISRWSWPDLKRLAPAWAGAALLGFAAYAHILWLDATSRDAFPPNLFDPTFPRDLLLYLLGAPSLLAIGLWLSPVALGMVVLRRERRLWVSLALVAAAVAFLWLVVQPAYLYPRFFIFLIPGCAFLAGAAIARWKVLAPVVALGAVAAVIVEVPGYTSDSLALRQAAEVVAGAGAAGHRACVIHSDEQVLGAYSTGFTTVTEAGQLRACDLVVVVTWGVDLSLRDEAAREFTRARRLPAGYPAVVLER